MSSVTLETLWADFDQARVAHRLHLEMCNASRGTGTLVWPEAEFAERCDRTLAIYEIAEEYGLDAAMLFKLSDGAIDPRKP